jgi:hypothetical protein
LILLAVHQHKQPPHLPVCDQSVSPQKQDFAWSNCRRPSGILFVVGQAFLLSPIKKLSREIVAMVQATESWQTMPGKPLPIELKTSPMPADNCLRLYKNQRTFPPWPELP